MPEVENHKTMTPLEKAHAAHQAAMELAEDAFLAERKGEWATATELHRRAFLLESEAAEALADRFEIEPTRSILYRSAATLALRSGELRAAERLVIAGLAGKPPEEIATELRAVLDETDLASSRAPVQAAVPRPEACTSEKTHYFNGLGEETGDYLLPPLSTLEFAVLIRKLHGPQPFPQWMADWLKKFAVLDPDRHRTSAPQPWDLSEAGWGVIYGPKVDRATRLAIEELVEYRRDQVGSDKGHLVRVYMYREGETTYQFLLRHGANPTMAADPDRFPFYLLLVGDPESLPYHFQYELDVQYAVGRLYFDQPEDYRHYTRSVIEAESRPFSPQHRLTFFGVRNPGDETTRYTTDELIEPLSDSVLERGTGWEALTVIGDDARKERLLRILGGDETPDVLFTASHGLGLNSDAGERQFERQGALICQDWPGPASGRVEPWQYFSAADLADDAMVHGLIAFLFACHSAGSPGRDNSTDDTNVGRPRRIAPRPFVSRLPQRLLAHPRGGALAVIGHIDRPWTNSFKGSPTGEGSDVFRHCLQLLLEGHTIGYAMQRFNQTAYAALAAQLDLLWQAPYREAQVDPNWLTWLWGASNDFRSFILLGDPAVRIPGMRKPPPVR